MELMTFRYGTQEFESDDYRWEGNDFVAIEKPTGRTVRFVNAFPQRKDFNMEGVHCERVNFTYED